MLKKYSITALFSLLLIFTGFTSGGFAQTPETIATAERTDAVADVEKVNAKIYTEIAKVKEKVEKMYADYNFVKANATNEAEIAAAWHQYDAKAEAEIAKLQIKTEEMTNKGVEKAIAAGLNVEIYLVHIKFADREREIDPIKVMDW